MKSIFAVFIALALAVVSQFALAAAAVVTELVGTAQRISDGVAPVALKKGDPVNERDTVTTAANSGVVLRFEDGQISALGANTRMTVSTYTYDAKEPAKSNVLLSLLTGGMRAVTGLIGKARPDKVAFRAGTATIGIRGTDISFSAIEGNIVVTVENGSISITFPGQAPITVATGQGALLVNGRLTTGTVAAIVSQARESAPALTNSIQTLQQLVNAVTQAVSAPTSTEVIQGETLPTTPPCTVPVGASAC